MQKCLIATTQSKCSFQKQILISNSNEQQILLNEQQIKLYISLSQQPIPDIVTQIDNQNYRDQPSNQNYNQINAKRHCQLEKIDQSPNIYSHFRFFFNDDQICIEEQHPDGKNYNIFYLQHFQEQINSLYRLWIGLKEQGDKYIQQQLKYKNFIAFAQYWVRKSPNLRVYYTLYYQLIQNCIDNCISSINNKLITSLTSPSAPFKLKQIIYKNQTKDSKNKTQITKITQQIQIKRLQIYFQHFSKASCTSNTFGSSFKKSGKTFQQINKSYTSINLGQWISFVKSFQFDKIYTIKQKQLKNNKQIKLKSIRWSNCIHYFKNLFQKYCNSQKNLSFEKFLTLLHQLFSQLCVHQPQQSISSTLNKINTNHEQQQIQCTSAYQTGIRYLLLHNLQQFNKKLRSLGVFVPLNLTHLQPKISKRKQLQNINPRYLQRKQLPTLSSQKIAKGKQTNGKIRQEFNNKILHVQNKSKKGHLYTISSLKQNTDQTCIIEPKHNTIHGSAKKYPIKQSNNRIKLPKIQLKPIQQQICKSHGSQISQNSVLTMNQLKNQKHVNNTNNKLFVYLNQVQDQPDQYLSRFYVKHIQDKQNKNSKLVHLHYSNFIIKNEDNNNVYNQKGKEKAEQAKITQKKNQQLTKYNIIERMDMKINRFKKIL